MLISFLHIFFIYYISLPHLHLHSFPTRRSSDLSRASCARLAISSSLRRLRSAISASLRMSFGERVGSRSVCGLYCMRSEEHTSELQSRFDLVCRLLLEKKNK